MAILVQIDADSHQSAKAAARAAGLTLQEFCRRAVIDATATINGNGGDNLQDLIRQIHKAICPSVDRSDESVAAVDALVQMQIPRDTAARKVAAIRTAAPDLPAEDIVRAALKVKG